MDINEISIPVAIDITLYGNFKIPFGATSLVIFSHGSGSSRFSSRNNYVAEILNKEKIATLLTDLLTEEEDLIYENRFNIDLISSRLINVTEHVSQKPDVANLAMGYFGASTGAASALNAAARLNGLIHAVVSRGGRPDLSNSLPRVQAPTLLIVGSLDGQVIDLNKKAFSALRCEKQIEIVEGASHLFEEPGKLDEVGVLAKQWFKKHLIYSKPDLTKGETKQRN
jgi:putative phosphoribosyl transferase